MSNIFARSCRSCGCTDAFACPGGCSWVDQDLCSACDDDPVEDRAGGAAFEAEDDCPANPLGIHQVLWTDGASGYCVRCRTPVHA
jgi:hypothetical protein